MGQTGLSEAIYEDLDNAQQALIDGNQAGALELATLISNEVIAEMESARATRIASSRVPRIAVTAGVLLVALIFFWGRRGPHTLLSIIGAGVAIGVYYGWYRFGGYTFSLSVVDTIDGFTTTLAGYATIGMIAGGLLLLVGLLLEDERRWSAAIMAGYDYGLYAVFLAAVPALVGFWKQGAIIRWYLPDLGLSLAQFVALVQVTIMALLAIPLPWMIALVVLGVGRWRTYSEARTQAWDPIARLRRR
jgi:hypothetical protein